MAVIIINTVHGMTHYVAIDAIASFKASGDGQLMISLVNGESLLTDEYASADIFFRTIRNIQRLNRIRTREGE